LVRAPPQDLDKLSDQEIERLRTAVVIKTYSNLIRHHKCRTPEDAKAQLADVASFGKALFANIRGSETTRYAELKITTNLLGASLNFEVHNT
jgi:hypothetical protein